MVSIFYTNIQKMLYFRRSKTSFPKITKLIVPLQKEISQITIRYSLPTSKIDQNKARQCAPFNYLIVIIAKIKETIQVLHLN